MKGVVFTEFQQLVEDNFGMETYDAIVAMTPTASEGAYTAVGTYDYRELVSLVVALSKTTGVPVPELIKTFGRYLFQSFARSNSHMLEGISSTIELLQNLETVIHVEVRKLTPNAELPSFEMCELDENHFEVVYRSSRPFADLCEGLLEAAIEHCGDPLVLSRTDLSDDGTAARFVLTHQHAADEGGDHSRAPEALTAPQ